MMGWIAKAWASMNTDTGRVALAVVIVAGHCCRLGVRGGRVGP